MFDNIELVLIETTKNTFLSCHKSLTIHKIDLDGYLDVIIQISPKFKNKSIVQIYKNSELDKKYDISIHLFYVSFGTSRCVHFLKLYINKTICISFIKKINNILL